ncbi:MAG: TrbC/VirB2 family protein [Candidatus Paceibacterota bacterium]|jgi:hypothetical protein
MKTFLPKIQFGVIFFICSLLLFLPVTLLAENQTGDSGFHLVVCGTGEDGAMDCDFSELKKLVGKTFDYVIGYIILPIATILIIWAGFKTIWDSSQGKDPTFYREMLRNVIIGVALAVGAYAIVKTFISLFFDSGGAFQAVIEEVFGQ